jgi:hypothetical protein
MRTLAPLPQNHGLLTLVSESGKTCTLKCKCNKQFDVAATRWRCRRLRSCGCETKRIHDSITYTMFRRG